MKNIKNCINTMDFKLKVALLIISIIPLGIYLILTNIFLVKNSTEIEKTNVINKIIHAKNILDMKGEALLKTAKDYAYREEIYINLANEDEDWIQRNLLQLLNENHGVEMIIMTDKSGEILSHYGVLYDDISPSNTGGAIDIMIKEIHTIHTTEGTYGLMEYNKELYMLAVVSNVNKEKGNFSEGSIILGKKINDEFLEALEKSFKLNLFLHKDGTIIFASTEDVQYLHSETQFETIENNIIEDNIKFIAGDTNIVSIPLVDMLNREVASLALLDTRELISPAKEVLYKEIYRTLIISTIIILLLSNYLRNGIMNPVKKICNDIKKMTKSSKISEVDVQGLKETEDLAIAFNEMVYNINNEKRINKDLREKLEYDRLKTEFLANISHELRTPLNVMLASLQLLEGKVECKCCYEKLRNHTKIMKQNCYRLLRLANNLIDITKIDAGLFHINKGNHNIVSIIEDVTLAVADYIKNQNIVFEFDTEIEEKIIACDPDKIERIILNLLSNAVKFSKSGGKIYVNIYDGSENIEIVVKDTGIGIPIDKQDVLFQRFRQVEELLTRTNEGSGMGLTLVKSLVEMHGGSISFKSKWQEGSQFLIKLPVKDIKINASSIHNKELEHSRWEKVNIEFSDIQCG